MSDYNPRLAPTWAQVPFVETAPRIEWTARLARWSNQITALIAVMLIVGVVAIDPIAHPVMVILVTAAALAAMAVVRGLDAEPNRVVVVIGADQAVARVARVVRSERKAIRLAGGQPVQVRRADSWADAAKMVTTSACQELVFAGCDLAPRANLIDATGRLAPIVTGAEAIQRRLGLVPLDLVGQDQWFKQLSQIRPLDTLHTVVKRAIDLSVVVGLGLVVLPFIPFIALAIRLESPGSIFYSQTRVGLGGRAFRIFKFRSMRQDAERDGARWAQTGDARVTKVGRFMRLTRIDELPQLWNVLKGEMTLVGPRPERPEFTTVLEQEIPHYAKRHAVKPGLTGWAQVRFRYTSSIEDTARKLEYDLYYLKHASLALDLRILVATIGVVLRKAGC